MDLMNGWEALKKEGDLEWKVKNDPRLLRICLLCYGFGMSHVLGYFEENPLRLKQTYDELVEALLKFKGELDSPVKEDHSK